MAYTDANFNATIQDTVIGGGPSLGVGLGTVTASATQTYTGVAGSQVNGTFRLPIFTAPVNIQGIRVYCTAPAAAGVSGVKMSFMNGTQVIGSVQNVGLALGSFDVPIAAPVVAPNGAQSGPTFFTSTSSNEILMLTTATGTASGLSLGSYSVDLVWRNLFTQ